MNRVQSGLSFRSDFPWKWLSGSPHHSRSARHSSEGAILNCIDWELDQLLCRWNWRDLIRSLPPYVSFSNDDRCPSSLNQSLADGACCCRNCDLVARSLSILSLVGNTIILEEWIDIPK